MIAVASFGWAMWETAGNPTWAYFSTFSRAWELAVGALLAVRPPRWPGFHRRVRPLLSYSGLLVIGVGLFVISADSAFPGPWAVVPGGRCRAGDRAPESAAPAGCSGR